MGSTFPRACHFNYGYHTTGQDEFGQGQIAVSMNPQTRVPVSQVPAQTL